MPAPAANPISSAPAVALATDRNTTGVSELNADLVSRRGENHCSPTGPKHCNFWLDTWLPIASARFQRDWKVFDHNCDQIGGEDTLRLGRGDYSLTSQLPYTIELHAYGGFRPRGHIMYAGRKTDLGQMYCGSFPLAAARCCRVAFECR